ncbi:MAG TPA: M28 family peptidase [Myxococcales bacterium]|jgi:hypothetical protein
MELETAATVASPVNRRAHQALAWTRRILDACGPRPAGSEACRKAAELIAADLRGHCDRVEIQPFECHPHAFIWHHVLTAPVTLAASVLLARGSALPAFALLLLVLALSILEFGFYRELLDPLFPRRRCTNVMGVLEPQGGQPVRRQVVLSAHHDSAYEFRFLRHSKAVYILALGWVALTLYALPIAAGLVVWLGAGLPSTVSLLLGLFGAVGSAIGLFLVSPRSVPGAGDNLVASGILVSVASQLRERLGQDPGLLHGTRVIFASFDAEESGLRGARAFVRDQQALLASAPTSDVDLDSFFHLDSLSALVSDLNGFVKLSEELVAMLEEEAKALGVPFCRRQMFYGIGATDAAEFARAGIPATCIVGMSPSPLHPKPLPYHTRDDLPENLEPEVVEAGIELSLRMILRLARQ